MNDDAIKPVSDEEFRIAQRVSDAKAARELKAKMRAKPLEAIIETFAGKAASDPAAPLGACEKCGAPYEASESGRLKDHVCADIAAQMAVVSEHQHTTVTAEERRAERAVERTRFAVHRVRRDTEDGEE